MLYQIVEEGNSATVTLGSELDITSGRVLKEKLEGLSGNIEIVILDLKNVTYINSSGIGQLVSVLKVCTLCERQLRLVNLSENVSQVLTITKLDRVLSIFPNIEDAKKKP